MTVATPPARAPARQAAALVALPPWLAARALAALLLLVLAAWGAAWGAGGVAGWGGLPQAGAPPDARGLWVWDAAWYRSIAELGYPGAGLAAGADEVEGVRFFPLLPLLGRVLAVPLAGNVELALLVLSGAGALAFGALLVRLVRLETGDEAAARRVAWLGALAPGAGVLVLAYTEPIAGALAAGYFLVLRRAGDLRREAGRRLLLAVPLGLLSGLARPTGVLLVAPALVEALRARPTGLRPTAAWAGVALSPAVGTGLYLAWSWRRFGDPFLPYTVQTRPGLRGGLAVDPRSHLLTTVPGGLDWRLKLALLLLALALLVVVARRLGASYAVWSALTMAAAVSSSSGHSLPRYLAGTFPLLMAAALVTGGRRWAPVLGAVVVLHAYLALAGYAAWHVL